MAAESVTPQTQAPKRQTPKSGVVVPNQPTSAQRFAAWIVFILIRSVAVTIRYRWTDRSGFYSRPPAPQAIYATWHNRLALCLAAYHGYAKKRTQTPGIVAMVSASKDGALLSAIFEKLGAQVARGSSSRRGSQALRELTTWAKRGYDLGITPDGPRGPSYIAQDGAIFLAQLTGMPIMPYSFRLDWKIRLKSWDRFQIPLPFSRCEVFYGQPIYVPREASAEEREKFRRQLEQSLNEISPD